DVRLRAVPEMRGDRARKLPEQFLAILSKLDVVFLRLEPVDAAIHENEGVDVGEASDEALVGEDERDAFVDVLLGFARHPDDPVHLGENPRLPAVPEILMDGGRRIALLLEAKRVLR